MSAEEREKWRRKADADWKRRRVLARLAGYEAAIAWLVWYDKDRPEKVEPRRAAPPRPFP